MVQEAKPDFFLIEQGFHLLKHCSFSSQLQTHIHPMLTDGRPLPLYADDAMLVSKVIKDNKGHS